MKGNLFISVLIAVALCFGQLASNTHVLSHFSETAQTDDHSELGHNHHSQPILHINAILADSSDVEDFDCAIYHTFAGSYCLITVQDGDVSAKFDFAFASVIPRIEILTGIFDIPHIRGPPQFS